MKKRILTLVALGAILATLAGSAGAASPPTTFYYGDITLDGSRRWMPGTWDLNACPLTVSYTLDLTGAPNVAYTGNYGQSGYVGLVWPGSTSAGAWMSGFLADWDNLYTEFPVFPDKNGTQDLDDKFNMQRSPNPGSWSETMYDVYCATNTIAESPFGSGSNYGIWFDRDGVDQWQATQWGMVDGGTYNTEGVYDVEILYRSAGSQQGTACPRFFPALVNPLNYSDPNDDISGVPTGFTPYSSYFPAGISFDTDETKMGSMQVFVSGDPGNGAIIVRDLQVTGCLALEEGMATGGGWFVAEDTGGVGNVTPGGKATFGFVAKQKNGVSSGQLEFQYQTDSLSLKSTSYDWVTLSNTQVIFEGTGRLNEVDGYKFRVHAFDGDKVGGVDRFTIRIWTGNDDYLMPTHRAEGDLGGGQIVVHKK